jgi:FkbM family methyltransferase
MSFIRRIRFEIAQRLNRRRPQRDYRWTRRPKNGRLSVLLRDSVGRERELSLRPNGSDFDVFLQIFEQRQYDTSAMRRHGDIQAQYAEILAAGKIPLIVDAGANVGLSALYFRDRYPKAKILAIEPEAGNFAELVKRSDELTVPIQAGLANFDGWLEVCDPGLGDWGFRTRRADAGVPAIRLSTLLETWAGEPFILKVDIEGFEADLFDDPALLDRFTLLYFEPHDWMLPGQGSAGSFLRAIAGLDRDFLIAGENIASIANR